MNIVSQSEVNVSVEGLWSIVCSTTTHPSIHPSIHLFPKHHPASLWPAALPLGGLLHWDTMEVVSRRGQYISWTLIGWLTFTMLPSGMGQRTSEGERRREIRLWAIRLMKEENGVKGQEKVALRQISLEESRTNCSDSFSVQHWDTDWQKRNKSQDTLSLGERITLNVLF